jgi:hypothetical protein
MDDPVEQVEDIIEMHHPTLYYGECYVCAACLAKWPCEPGIEAARIRMEQAMIEQPEKEATP